MLYYYSGGTQSSVVVAMACAQITEYSLMFTGVCLCACVRVCMCVPLALPSPRPPFPIGWRTHPSGSFARSLRSLGGMRDARMCVVGALDTGKAHALGLLDRAPYLLWLSTTVVSLVLSPLLMRAFNAVRGLLGDFGLPMHAARTLADLPKSKSSHAPAAARPTNHQE